MLKKSGFECIYLPKSGNTELESIVELVDAWIIRSETKINYRLINISRNLEAIKNINSVIQIDTNYSLN